MQPLLLLGDKEPWKRCKQLVTMNEVLLLLAQLILALLLKLGLPGLEIGFKSFDRNRCRGSHLGDRLSILLAVER